MAERYLSVAVAFLGQLEFRKSSDIAIFLRKSYLCAWHFALLAGRLNGVSFVPFLE